MAVKPRVSPYCDQIGKYPTHKWLVNLSYLALLLIAIVIIFAWALPLWISLIPMGLLAIVGLTYIFISTRRCDQNVNG